MDFCPQPLLFQIAFVIILAIPFIARYTNTPDNVMPKNINVFINILTTRSVFFPLNRLKTYTTVNAQIIAASNMNKTQNTLSIVLNTLMPFSFRESFSQDISKNINKMLRENITCYIIIIPHIQPFSKYSLTFLLFFANISLLMRQMVYAEVAQLIERCLAKAQVAGLSPVSRSKYGAIAKW